MRRLRALPEGPQRPRTRKQVLTATRFSTGGMLLALVWLLLLTGGPAASAKERPWLELQSHNFLVVSAEAQEALARAVATAPEDPGLHLALADHLAWRASSAHDGAAPNERRALREEAREHYLRCISLESRSCPQAISGWGASYRGQEGDLGPGIAALETAHAQLRSATPISLALAALYAEAGASEKARRPLDEVMQWSRDDEEIEAARELLAGLARIIHDPS
jgi:hypothetical protein